MSTAGFLDAVYALAVGKAGGSSITEDALRREVVAQDGAPLTRINAVMIL